ncbi:DUF3841 domain-containing protein [Nonomuraea roseoviolacea]|uniref:Uncharacterized protein n=1 Tax=Nonomuraea roseoviolacea subsp. carminata TaxID=160689 RepID=A0ABT1KAR6_9ACTN|nr:DUF3841 domain-containing protein [Nonomuraea roseoviolacea]MCP2351040.1 hypothetical protein [Nonomuraea roseoviolacea subsp. carminata]
MRLWTVQHRVVPEALAAAGEVTGDWGRVLSPSYRPAYEEMTAEMARRGLDCAGRPPLWAWHGPDTRDDRVALTAELLLNPATPQEYERYAVLDLDVPDEVVMLSSYARWNDFMETLFLGRGSPAMDWSIDAEEYGGPAGFRVQACLPRLAAPWVLGVRPLEPSEG